MSVPTVVCPFDDCPTFRRKDKPMKVTDETYTHVIYVCPTCQRTRVVDKKIVGGTIGAGRHESKTGRVVGRGL